MHVRRIRQILVEWLGSSPEELSEFQTTYLSYHLEDKVNFEGEGSVTLVLQEDGRPNDPRGRSPST
ncbi:hypothetical protein Tco_1435357, partial [Tanacetum coccineum]